MYEYQVHPNWKPRASFPDFLSYRLMRLCSKMQKPKSYWTVTETTPFDGEEGKKSQFLSELYYYKPGRINIYSFPLSAWAQYIVDT